MNILFINGSPNSNGNTAALAVYKRKPKFEREYCCPRKRAFARERI